MPRSFESRAAMAAQKREYRAAVRAEYLELCEQHDVEPQLYRFKAHREELRNGGVFVRLSKEQMFAFWRERLSDREIREIGSSLDFLAVEEGVAA